MLDVPANSFVETKLVGPFFIKRISASDESIRQDSPGPIIDALVVSFVLDDFWCSKHWRAAKGVGFVRDVLGCRRSGQQDSNGMS